MSCRFHVGVMSMLCRAGVPLELREAVSNPRGGSQRGRGIFFSPFPPCLLLPPSRQSICPQEGRGDVATSDLVAFNLPVPLRKPGVVEVSDFTLCNALCREGLRSSAVYLGDFPR